MTIGTILRYQFGERRAIEEAANNRGTLITGFVLVLMTAVARNYDQTFILESPLWLLGPVLFSLVSGTFFFLVLYFGFIRRHLEGPQEFPAQRQWRTFLGLFWMTAPIGWLYAIPVERFLSSYDAAKANLILLGVVALGRVLLMGRIISVVQGMDWKRAVGWVLIPAAIEVLVTIFLGLIFEGLGRRTMASMAGLRNSPESVLIETALLRTTTGAVVVLCLVSLWLNLTKFDKRVVPFPCAAKLTLPVIRLISFGLGWALIAVPAQREQARFLTHARLVKAGKYREAIDFLTHYRQKDFPASRRLEPDPYEIKVFESLPATMKVLRSDDPEWIHKLYLDYLTIMFRHQGAYFYGYSPNAYAQALASLNQFPAGSNWIRLNSDSLARLRGVAESESDMDSKTLGSLLLGLGVPSKPRETNQFDLRE